MSKERSDLNDSDFANAFTHKDFLLLMNKHQVLLNQAIQCLQYFQNSSSDQLNNVHGHVDDLNTIAALQANNCNN